MAHLKSVPCIGTLLYSTAAIVIVTCSFLRDGMIWFFAMQVIAFPTNMIFRVLPLPLDLSRNFDRGLFVAAIVVNGVVLYLSLLAVQRVVKLMRVTKPKK